MQKQEDKSNIIKPYLDELSKYQKHILCNVFFIFF